jgi:signal transduction histidine kinase
VSTISSLADGERETPREAVCEIFHSLSQPLTALHCSLELSLLRDQTAEEFRSSVAAALENAERLRQRLLLCRELSSADDPGDISAAVSLQQLLRELCEEMRPLAEFRGQHLGLQCPPLRVRGNELKLTRAFFYLLEFLLRSSPQDVRINIRAGQREQHIEVVFENGISPAQPDGQLCPTEIARRSFRAVGGELTAHCGASGQTSWTALLPLAE